jgi:hypothetical protein
MSVDYSALCVTTTCSSFQTWISAHLIFTTVLIWFTVIISETFILFAYLTWFTLVAIWTQAYCTMFWYSTLSISTTWEFRSSTWIVTLSIHTCLVIWTVIMWTASCHTQTSLTQLTLKQDRNTYNYSHNTSNIAVWHYMQVDVPLFWQMLTLYTEASNLICLVIHAEIMAALQLILYIHFITCQVFTCGPPMSKIIHRTTVLQYLTYENI